MAVGLKELVNLAGERSSCRAESVSSYYNMPRPSSSAVPCGFSGLSGDLCYIAAWECVKPRTVCTLHSNVPLPGPLLLPHIVVQLLLPSS